MNSRPRQLSIRARLALIYTALLAAALGSFGAGIYVVMRDQLERTFDAQLLANAEHAAGAFAQDVTADGVLVPSERLIAQFASTGGRIVVLDPAGAVVADSQAGAMPLAITPNHLRAAAAGARVLNEQAVANDVVRIALEPIVASTGIPGFIAWADSTSPLKSLLATVASALLLGGAIVALGALLVGLVLARRALQPVSTVTETARAISLSGDFGARVEPGNEHDEVGQLALAFNEMLAAVEDSHRTLQRFLADASHQLRTPLTSIRANLDLAQRPGLPRPERDAILADARDEADRMARLIRDLLSLARAESGAQLAFEPLQLDELLVETLRRATQGARHLTVSIAEIEPARVEADADRLRELFGILLDNATRYTPDGGRIVIRQSVDGSNAIVRIEDTGIGLGDEDPERFFERLYRGPAARRLRPSGTGLGLSIARWIAEAHGGTVTLADRPTASGDSRGTVATVTLPIVAQDFASFTGSGED